MTTKGQPPSHDVENISKISASSSKSPCEQALWDSYNHLMKCPDVGRLRKFLARAECFRMAIDVPGDIVECGVFKGTGFMQFLKLREIFLPGSLKRVIGFDLFDSLPKLKDDADQIEMDFLFEDSNFKGVTTEELTKVGNAIVKTAGVFEFVKGEICLTAKEYVEKHPGFRISFLDLDLDVAEPTLGALEAFWPRVSRGGVVVLDEYAISKWSESQAVDQFLADKPDVVLKSMPWAQSPTAYIIKP